MTRRMAALYVSFAVLSATAVFGRSGISIGPLARVDDLSIQVTIGYPSALDDDDATPLFGATPSLRAGAEAAIRDLLTEHLTRAGVRVWASPDRALMVGIYGGHFKASGSTHNFYEVWVAYAGPEDECGAPSKTILGTAPDQDLQHALVATAASIVDEFIEQRRLFGGAVKSAAVPGCPPNPSLQRTRQKRRAAELEYR